MDEQTRDDAQESLVRVGADALAAQITRPWSRHKSSEFTHGQGALLHAQRFRAAATHRRDQLARRQQGYDRADRERLRHGPELELLHAHMRSSASQNNQCLLVVGVKAVLCAESRRTVLRRAGGLTAPRHTVASRRGIRGRGHLGANTRARPHSSQLLLVCRQGRRPSSRRRSPARAGLSPDGGAAHTRAKQRARRERGDSLRRRGVRVEREAIVVKTASGE